MIFLPKAKSFPYITIVLSEPSVIIDWGLFLYKIFSRKYGINWLQKIFIYK